MNPGDAFKAMNAMNKFQGNHPKFTSFLRAMFGSKIEEGTVIEITVTRPGEEPITGNMRVQAADLELVEELRHISPQ